MTTNPNNEQIILGISSCLLGEPVRFDGGHKSNVYIKTTLGKHFQFKSFCPEVEAGLGVPRETLGLIETNGEQHIVYNSDTSRSLNKPFTESASRQVKWQESICGYILKSKSPSCGMQQIDIIRDGTLKKNGTGIYASILIQHFPNLPIESEDRLSIVKIRQQFIRRVFVYHRWKKRINNQPTLHAVKCFHRQHTSLLMASDSSRAEQLSSWLEQAHKLDFDVLLLGYEKQLMLILQSCPTRTSNTMALQQLIKPLLLQSNKTRNKVKTLLDEYSKGLLTFNSIRKSVNEYQQESAKESTGRDWYLQPDRREIDLLSNDNY